MPTPSMLRNTPKGSSTIHDVATVAGVSVATISRVINNQAGVSNRMRQRVLDAINLCAYKPNAHAQQLGLASGKVRRK